MEMTPHEIARDFRTAKNKHTQIQILADLNLCKPSDIVDILYAEGVDGRTIPKEYKPGQPQAQEPAPKQAPSFRKPTPPPPPKPAPFAPPTRSTSIKPRALHDWDRLVDIAKAVRDSVAAGETPESVWIQEMSDTLIRYYPVQGEKK